MPSFTDDTEDELAKKRAKNTDHVGRRVTFSPGQDFQKGMQQEEREIVKRAERLAAPPQITEPRCHVCQSPHRNYIETMLVKGISYMAISERTPGKDGAALDRRSISNHYRNHMDLEGAATRALLEDEAQLVGQNYEEGFRGAITKRGVLEVALRKGFEDVLNGITTVEPKDLIQIAKILGEMDSKSFDTGLDEVKSQFALFVQAIQDVCDASTQVKISERIKELRKHDRIEDAIERALVGPAITVESEALDDLVQPADA